MDPLQAVVSHGPAHVLEAPLLEQTRQHEPRVALRIEVAERVLREQPGQRPREGHLATIP